MVLFETGCRRYPERVEYLFVSVEVTGEGVENVAGAFQ